MEKERINRVQKTVPGLAFGRVRCPACGNSIQFVERAESIMVTTFYNQNGDGSFTMVSQNAEIGGELSFLVPQQNLWVTLGAGRSPSA